MALGNFYVSTEADGRVEQHAFPAAQEGGIRTRIRVRHHGKSLSAIEVSGYHEDGKNVICVFGPDGAVLARFEYVR